VVGNGHAVVIPRGAARVDYEGELAFIAGKRLRRAGPEEAAEGILGYTIMNDVTDREAQRERVWFRSKSADTFAPMGPWIVTADELADPLNLGITTKVNDEVRQSGSTRNLIFTPADIVAFITRYITLEPGDVVSTGTPGGVGVFRKPPVFLQHGDVVEITIEGIGTLVNPVISES
jgi:2-keto-4-pentenoate hydratase/2-oxohepta-3-ene-1,7-dioic acid hydratase in catechol pathway